MIPFVNENSISDFLKSYKERYYPDKIFTKSRSNRNKVFSTSAREKGIFKNESNIYKELSIKYSNLIRKNLGHKELQKRIAAKKVMPDNGLEFSENNSFIKCGSVTEKGSENIDPEECNVPSIKQLGNIESMTARFTGYDHKRYLQANKLKLKKLNNDESLDLNEFEEERGNKINDVHKFKMTKIYQRKKYKLH